MMRGSDRLKRAAHEDIQLRGTGRTTRAMQALPLNAIYIVNQVSYHQKIRDGLNRPDIRIIDMNTLDGADYCWRGRDCEVHVDHAIELTRSETESLHAHNAIVARRLADRQKRKKK